MNELQEIIAAFPMQTLLIVGDVMLDEYIWGDVRRISPEAPVPIVEIRRRSYVPGGAANVAANAVALGARILLGGVVGADPSAEQLRTVLQQQCVGIDGMFVDASRPTTVKSRIVAHNQHVVRLDTEACDALSVQLETSLLSWIDLQLATVNAVVISDYAKGVLSFGLTQRLIAMAHSIGCPVIADPKTNNFSKYQGATVITPNQFEAEQATGMSIHDESSLHSVGDKLLANLKGSALLITRAAQGMSLFVQGQIPVHIPTEARDVYDVTGAGDTALTTFALAIAAGATLEQATCLANKAAGIVVGKVGTATVTVRELMRHVV